MNVNQQGELHDLEQENHVDNQRDGSSQTIHAGRSGYRRRGHLVQERADEKDLQREIEDLKKKLLKHNEIKPLQVLMSLPTMKERTATGNAQKLHPVNPIPMKRNTLTRGGEKVRLEGEWDLRS